MPPVNRGVPRVTRQTVAAVDEVLAAKGAGKAQRKWVASVLDAAVSVDQLQSQAIQMVLYGQNRVGKTTLACQWPKPLLLVSLEPSKTGGAASVRKVPGVVWIHLRSSTEFVQLASVLRSNGLESDKWPGRLATVVVDSATSLQDVILKELLDLPEVPDMLRWGMATMDHYRERSEKCRECLRPYLNLDCHLVVTAKERDHNPPKDSKNVLTRGMQHESFFAADLGGATAQWLMDACDYVCQLYVAKQTVTRQIMAGGKVVKEVEEETGRVVRRLRCMFHTNFAAGFRSASPEAVPEYLEEPTFAAVQAVIDGTPP